MVAVVWHPVFPVSPVAFPVVPKTAPVVWSLVTALLGGPLGSWMTPRSSTKPLRHVVLSAF